ncbi:MAG: DUF4433 domain-containing protein [Verrucomicrobia bacterium]|nr:DUF4433 domain-containing protein [Verrucomicrobiota bacterium]MBV8642023.1 DUF4433 domain-containing protein [Verrucomicrobiota bacterium]
MAVPTPTLVYRITHLRNLPWILEHGICCRSHEIRDPNFMTIGNTEIISRRDSHSVSIGAGGKLSDYVPFYFCSHSMMLYQIHTRQVEGCTAVQKDLVFLVSSLQKFQERRTPFLFTDGHALMVNTNYFDSLADLNKLDWITIRSKDFRRRMDDLDRTRRYQAECLVYNCVPVDALVGIACFDANCLNDIEDKIKPSGNAIPVKVKRNWYF